MNNNDSHLMTFETFNGINMSNAISLNILIWYKWKIDKKISDEIYIYMFLYFWKALKLTDYAFIW